MAVPVGLVGVRMNQFMYGLYPETEYWRINLGGGAVGGIDDPVVIKRFPWKRWLVPFVLFGYPVIAFVLFSGGAGALNMSRPAVGAA